MKNIVVVTLILLSSFKSRCQTVNASQFKETHKTTKPKATKEETVQWITEKLETFSNNEYNLYPPNTIYKSHRFTSNGSIVHYITEKYLQNNKTETDTVTFDLNAVQGDVDTTYHTIYFLCNDNDMHKNRADIILTDNCVVLTYSTSNIKEYVGGFEFHYRSEIYPKKPDIFDSSMALRLQNAFLYLWSLNQDKPEKF